jgi:hypothetical protein
MQELAASFGDKRLEKRGLSWPVDLLRHLINRFIKSQDHELNV